MLFLTASQAFYDTSVAFMVTAVILIGILIYLVYQLYLQLEQQNNWDQQRLRLRIDALISQGYSLKEVPFAWWTIKPLSKGRTKTTRHDGVCLIFQHPEGLDAYLLHEDMLKALKKVPEQSLKRVTFQHGFFGFEYNEK